MSDAAIARVWDAKGVYCDPLMKSDGHDGSARFAWSLGPAVVEGVDFCQLAADGRLASVTGSIDKMPR